MQMQKVETIAGNAISPAPFKIPSSNFSPDARWRSTFSIENVERHLASGEKLEDGILKGAGEIALPAMVSTFCICIVFVPMFSLAGVARYLFVPLAEAVMFAVISSYVLSRTLVPTLIMFFERHHHKRATGQEKRVAFWVRPLVGLR